MNKFIAFCVFLFPFSLYAQQSAIQVDKTLLCASTKDVFQSLATDWNEKPIWGSNLKDSKVILTVNKKTGSWTIIQFNKNLACILEVGADHFFFEETQ